jgi:NmrA-like family
MSGVPRTSFYTGFYIENLLNPMMAPKKVGEDEYLLQIPILPDCSEPLFSIANLAPIFSFPVNDTGAWVLVAFKDPETWIGKDIRIVTEWLSTRDMAVIMSRVTGKKVSVLELDQAGFDASKNAPWPGAEEIYLNMLFFVKVCFLIL